MMRWPWKRHGSSGVDPAAVRALEETRAAREEQRGMWHDVLQSAEELRALRVRNHFADRLGHAFAAQPAAVTSTMYNRRKDDPR